LVAGDVDGNLVAYDATNGNPLWHAEMGAVLSNAAETYLLDGHQYVLAAAGDTVYGFRLP
jgi:alcohol dehydrogenase (cytochrome c)